MSVCECLWQPLIIILRNFWAALQTKEGREVSREGGRGSGRKSEYACIKITNCHSFDYSPILPFFLSLSLKLHNCRMWSSHSYRLERDTCCFCSRFISLYDVLFLLFSFSPSLSSSLCHLFFQLSFLAHYVHSFLPLSLFSFSNIFSFYHFSPYFPASFSSFLAPFLCLSYSTISFSLSSHYLSLPHFCISILSLPRFHFLPFSHSLFRWLHHGAEYRWDAQLLQMFSCIQE